VLYNLLEYGSGLDLKGIWQFGLMTRVRGYYTVTWAWTKSNPM